MSVVLRLRLAFAAYAALMAAVLAYLAFASRRTLDVAHDSAELQATIGRVVAVPPPAEASPDSLWQLVEMVREGQIGIDVLREASNAAMARELERSRALTRTMERAALGVTLLAIALGALASWLLERAIARVDAVKEEFVASVSHDLKSPIATMQETHAVLLEGLAGPLTDRQRRLVGHNVESAGRLMSMVTKLLDLARLDARRGPELELVDVAAVAQRVVDRMDAAQRHSMRRAPSIVLDAPERPLLVLCEAENIERVLENLIENAIRYSPAEGRIVVGLSYARRPDAGVLITVSDNGPGIPDAKKVAVFERFYRNGNARSTRGRGVGLGLTICRRIVDEHGGSIEFRDNTPTGAVAVVTLPTR